MSRTSDSSDVTDADNEDDNDEQVSFVYDYHFKLVYRAVLL